jgi:hypothetical protein
LKARSPLPWLRWSGPGGGGGQTRNRGNFGRVWEDIVEKGTEGEVVWVTSTLFTGEFLRELGIEFSLDVKDGEGMGLGLSQADQDERNGNSTDGVSDSGTESPSEEEGRWQSGGVNGLASPGYRWNTSYRHRHLNLHLQSGAQPHPRSPKGCEWGRMHSRPRQRQRQGGSPGSSISDELGSDSGYGSVCGSMGVHLGDMGIS